MMMVVMMTMTATRSDAPCRSEVPLRSALFPRSFVYLFAAVNRVKAYPSGMYLTLRERAQSQCNSPIASFSRLDSHSAVWRTLSSFARRESSARRALIEIYLVGFSLFPLPALLSDLIRTTFRNEIRASLLRVLLSGSHSLQVATARAGIAASCEHQTSAKSNSVSPSA